jgi:hypothetical protein
MKSHYTNPTPEDLKDEKVNFYPRKTIESNYEDFPEPERKKEDERVTDERYITSLYGTDLITADPSDIQKMHDLIFIGFDNEYENTEMKPPYAFEQDNRQGENLYPHFSIYEQKGPLYIRDHVFLRLFSCELDDIIPGFNTTLFINDTKINAKKSIKGNDARNLYSEQSGVNCFIHLKNSGNEQQEWKIEELDNCFVILENCNIKYLYIFNNKNCTFIIRGGTSVGHRSTDLNPSTANNKNCDFTYIEHTASFLDDGRKHHINNKDCSFYDDESSSGCFPKGRGKNYFEQNQNIMSHLCNSSYGGH